MAWLEQALAPEWRLGDLEAHRETDGFAIADAAGDPVGLGVVRPEGPRPGAATFAFVTIDPARRYAGLGGEAALAAEAQARRRWPVDELLAPVPEGRGLAVYFWLRLGYRPLTGAEAPWQLLGLAEQPYAGIWLSCALSPSKGRALGPSKGGR